MLLDAPEGTRSAQESCLRAARKLARYGLVDLETVSETRRAYDPRREQPFYREGRLWVRTDKTRRHIVKRKVLWLTPLGDGVARIYDHELRTGARIRWTTEKLCQAEDYAAHHPVNRRVRTAWLEQLEQDLRSEGGAVAPIINDAIEYLPPFVSSAADLERWRLALRSVIPACGESTALIREARMLYDTVPLEDLAAAALTADERKPSRRRPPASRFRRDPLAGRMVAR